MATPTMPGKSNLPGIKGKAAGNLNKGGNEGNVFGGGRKRNAVREACLDGFESARPLLENIARGERCIQYLQRVKGREYLRTRFPSPGEMISAIDLLAKIALPARQEITGEDGEPLIPASGPDLSRLSSEKLRTLESILIEAAESA